ncbi:MAG: 30S ribosome-binding factor RbfA [Spirochaetes bacterium]|nr:30S ribosome-binding factor RbfA [Spirochaetota bacterium]
MAEFRLLRAEKIIQEEISKLILQDKIKDPRINKLVFISNVKISPDMGYAKVAVSGYCKEKDILKTVEGLNSAAGFIQGTIGKKIKTRLTPKLTFFYDNSIKEGFEINKLIEDTLS